MLRRVFAFAAVLLAAPWAHAAMPRFGEMASLCSETYTASTQDGKIPCWVGVCRLESAIGVSPSLYVVQAHERVVPPQIVRILNGGHSPIMEKKADRVTILFTQGVNSTVVAEFSVAKGILTFIREEVIAWNDSGTYRKSDSFPRYADLLAARDAAYRR